MFGRISVIIAALFAFYPQFGDDGSGHEQENAYR
jgi:hypothetical protein